MEQGKQTSLLGKAFVTWRGQPRVWLWLSIASLPILLSGLIPAGGFPISPYQRLVPTLLGTVLCFMLFFMSWCLAAIAYDAEERATSGDLLALWLDILVRRRGYYLRLAGRFWLYEILYFLVASLPLLIGLIPVLIRYGHDNIVYVVALGLFSFFGNLLSAFLVVRIYLSPQLAVLAGMDADVVARNTMRESIELVKHDYRRVLGMFLLPWVLGGAMLIVISLIHDYVVTDGLPAILLLLVSACVEGGRMSLIVAGCNEYFKETYR